MAELRKNVLTGDWVVIAAGRALRPESFSNPSVEPRKKDRLKSCPFCLGNEAETPPEVFAVRDADTTPDSPGWQVRVVPNKYPAFTKADQSRGEENDLFPAVPAYGRHEVIIHNPDHKNSIAQMTPDDLAVVLKVYQERLVDASQDPKLASTLIIVNHGKKAGASIEHPHSQLFSMPLVAPRIRREMEQAKKFKEQHGECPFCAMVKYEQSARTRLVAENNGFVAFCPFASSTPFEILLAPLSHQPDFTDVGPKEIGSLAEILREVLTKVSRRLEDPPYNMFLHTRPHRDSENDYHWHFSILPKISTRAGFEFGTNITINVAEPEAAADFLR